MIAKAKGLAVLSVIKAGFLVTARGGSGIVLARLPDGSKLVLVETLNLLCSSSVVDEHDLRIRHMLLLEMCCACQEASRKASLWLLLGGTQGISDYVTLYFVGFPWNTTLNILCTFLLLNMSSYSSSFFCL